MCRAEANVNIAYVIHALPDDSIYTNVNLRLLDNAEIIIGNTHVTISTVGHNDLYDMMPLLSK